jgi:small-conductance mechanosensitive channel
MEGVNSSINQWIQTVLGLGPVARHKLFTSIIIIIVLWLLRYVILRIVWKKTEDIRKRYTWQKVSAYAAMVIGIFVIGRLWFEGFQSIATFLGLLSAGLAIALRDLIINIAAWIFIIWRRPFSIGDRIQIGEHRGDVIDIRIFAFSLMEIGNWVDAEQTTGRIIHIPNGKVLTEPLANYSKGYEYIWNEVPVLITFESDWQKAKAILQEIAKKHAEHLSETAEKQIKEASKKFMIFYSTLTPSVITKVKDSGVQLTIRYLCEPRRRRASEQAIWEDILTEFAKVPNIDFAYPTHRFFDNQKEGKISSTDLTPKK